jgi:hypothetical protein
VAILWLFLGSSWAFWKGVAHACGRSRGELRFRLRPPGFAPESANRGGFSGGAVFLTPLVGFRKKLLRIRS